MQQGTTLEKNIAASCAESEDRCLQGLQQRVAGAGAGPRRRADRQPQHSAGFCQGNPNFKIVGDLFSVEPFGIGVRQGDSALRDEINFTLQDLWTSGEYTAALPQMVPRRPGRADRDVAEIITITAVLMSYHFDWLPIWEHRDILISGFAADRRGFGGGTRSRRHSDLSLGTLATAQSRLLRLGAGAVVECTRNVPLLIHMYFWYIGLAFLRLPPFLCAVFGLAIYSAAYVGGDRARRHRRVSRAARARRRSPPA